MLRRPLRAAAHTGVTHGPTAALALPEGALWNTAAYRDRVATILVGALAPVITAIEAAGGQVIEGPVPAPNGDRLIARHPDGAVPEYIEAVTG